MRRSRDETTGDPRRSSGRHVDVGRVVIAEWERKYRSAHPGRTGEKGVVPS